MPNDYSRQMNIFNPYEFNTPVTIIGAGASGSWLVLALAKLGIQDITVFDFDKVEEHNLPNQLYMLHQVHAMKVEALREMVLAITGVCIKAKTTAVDGNQRLRGVVFMMTDTMRSRKEIWEKAIKLKPGVQLLIEPRMGLSDGRIYTINPMDLKQIAGYEKTFYSDEEAAVSACGTSQSVVTTAMSIASMCVRQLINWHNGVELNNELLFDFMYNNIIATKFE